MYIEKDIFDSIDNETIVQHFQNMKTRRIQLENIFNSNVINNITFFVFIVN